MLRVFLSSLGCCFISAFLITAGAPMDPKAVAVTTDDIEICDKTVDVQFFDHSKWKNEKIEQGVGVWVQNPRIPGSPLVRSVTVDDTVGEYEVKLSYSIDDKTQRLHRKLFKILKVKCQSATATIHIKNETHSYVDCGVKTDFAPWVIEWREKSKGVIKELRNQTRYTFKNTVRGNFSCTQTFFAPVFASMTENFEVDQPEKPQVRIVCEGNEACACKSPTFWVKVPHGGVKSYRVQVHEQVQRKPKPIDKPIEGPFELVGDEMRVVLENVDVKLPAVFSVTAFSDSAVGSSPRTVITMLRKP